jgi:hypothetical protein
VLFQIHDSIELQLPLHQQLCPLHMPGAEAAPRVLYAVPHVTQILSLAPSLQPLPVLEHASRVDSTGRQRPQQLLLGAAGFVVIAAAAAAAAAADAAAGGAAAGVGVWQGLRQALLTLVLPAQLARLHSCKCCGSFMAGLEPLLLL